MSPVFAIDIGGTTVKGAVVTPDGKILDRQVATTEGRQGNLEFLAVVQEILNSFLVHHTPAAVGIGSPGPLDLEDGLIVASANMPGVKNCPIRCAVQEFLNNKGLSVPVFLNNDANCAALGQLVFGYGRNTLDFAVITLGTGVGGGLILGGRLFEGYSGNGFEIGHVPLAHLPSDGEFPTKPLRRCGCGALGCVETVASATGVSYSYQLLRGQNPNTIIPARDIAAAAEQGDKAAQQAFAYAGTALGGLIAGLVQTLNLPLFIITGGMAAAQKWFMPHLQTTLKAQIFPLFRERTNIICTAGDEDAGLLGAAALCFPT